MRKPAHCIAALLLGLLVSACNSPIAEDSPETKSAIPVYDSLKAREYGADDYGMKTYVMAFLKRGPARDIPAGEAAELQQAHLKNITRLAEESKLLLAGPFLDTGALRGIYLFDVRTIEEAEALTSTDPAIQAGSLEMELKPWYGSAALMELNKRHIQLQKKGISE